MKKVLFLFFGDILCNFKWYRKKTGGKWYKIREYEVGGFAAPGESWVQSLPADDQYHLIKEEEY